MAFAARDPDADQALLRQGVGQHVGDGGVVRDIDDIAHGTRGPNFSTIFVIASWTNSMCMTGVTTGFLMAR